MSLRHFAVLALAVTGLGLAACSKKPSGAGSENAAPADKGAGGKAGSGQGSANLAKSSENLRLIAAGVLGYADAMAKFPSPDGEPYGSLTAKPTPLSWRVYILPYIGQGPLFKEFKLNEAWDSPHNKTLIGKMPSFFAAPGGSTKAGETHYKALVGPGTLFEPNRRWGARQLNDAIRSNSIVGVESGDPVIWTKPGDIRFDPKKPLPDLSFAGSRRINVVMTDASRRTVDLDKVSENTLKAAITVDPKKVLGPDWETGAPIIPKN